MTAPVPTTTEASAALSADLDAWHEHACFVEQSAPDFWDEADTSARVAAWLIERGWGKVR